MPAAAREAAFAAVSTATRSARFSNLCSEARRADGRLCRFELAGATSAAVLETLAGNASGTSVFRERDGGVTPRGVRSFEARVDAKSVASRRRAAASSASSASLASLASLASPGLFSPLGSSPLLAAVAGEAFAGTSDEPSGDGDDVRDGTVIPVTAIRRAKPRGGVSGGADAGFTLLAPAECAQKLWLALVALGAHATGLREWRWLAVAAGAPAFPEELPRERGGGGGGGARGGGGVAKGAARAAGKRVPAAAIEGAARAAVAFARREKEGVTGVTGVTYARARRAVFPRRRPNRRRGGARGDPGAARDVSADAARTERRGRVVRRRVCEGKENRPPIAGPRVRSPDGSGVRHLRVRAERRARRRERRRGRARARTRLPGPLREKKSAKARERRVARRRLSGSASRGVGVAGGGDAGDARARRRRAPRSGVVVRRGVESS